MAANLNNAFDKFSQKNMGRNLINKTGEQLNKPLTQNNFNKNGSFGQNFSQNFNNYMNQGSDEDNEDIEQNGEQTEEQNKPDLVDKGVEAAGRAAASAYGGKLGEAAFDAISKTELGQKVLKKSSKKIKMYLYLSLAGLGLIIFLVVFIVVIIDDFMSNILNFTKWGEEEEESDVVNNENSSSSVVENSVVTIIGEDGVNKVNTKIKDLNITECSGSNVASVTVTLIDGLDNYNYKVPYSNYNKIDSQNSGVNKKWGGTFTEDNTTYTYGFNSFTFLAWAFGNSGVNKMVAIDMLEKYGESLEYSDVVPGDMFVNADNEIALLVIENNGGSFKVAETTNDGLKYSTYTTGDLNGYKALGMENYYKDNCSI